MLSTESTHYTGGNYCSTWDTFACTIWRPAISWQSVQSAWHGQCFRYKLLLLIAGAAAGRNEGHMWATAYITYVRIASLYVLDYKVLFLSTHPMMSRICWGCCMGNNPNCSHQPQLVAGYGTAWIQTSAKGSRIYWGRHKATDALTFCWQLSPKRPIILKV
jgi:hypothetical protein